jgi:hypothetical protein
MEHDQVLCGLAAWVDEIERNALHFTAVPVFQNDPVRPFIALVKQAFGGNGSGHLVHRQWEPSAFLGQKFQKVGQILL